jgi:K+-sensing histidine kinase KdpD
VSANLPASRVHRVLTKGDPGCTGRRQVLEPAWVVSDPSLSGRHDDDLETLFSMAHELRTPLAALAMSSEMLASNSSTLDRHEMAELVRRIRRTATWMRWLVDNWLCAAELDWGRINVQLRPTSISRVIAEARTIIEPLLTLKRQELKIAWRGTIADVQADGRRIQQVLINLITNASKFSDMATDITISAARRGDWVRISVADQGPGVSPEARRHLFQPFSRAREAIKNGSDGFGLGLAIVRAIVAEHGGRVGVENRPEGGACFWFELPVAEVGSQPPVSRAPKRDCVKRPVP